MTRSPQSLGAGTFIAGVALGALAAFGVLHKFSGKITPALACCPACGQSWEIKEGRSVPYTERMTYWDECPGCELPMRTGFLKKIAQSTEHGDA
jgi:hypothetical protein